MIRSRAKIPELILKQIIDNLSEVDEQNINFNNIQRKKLATDQKKLTNMMDMLYFDKLEGCISSEEHERHHQTLKKRQSSNSLLLARLDETKNDCLVLTKYLLDLANRAYEIFKSSEVNQK